MSCLFATNNQCQKTVLNNESEMRMILNANKSTRAVHYLWGIGGVGQRALNYLLPLGVLDGIIDNDPKKQGQIIDGLLVNGYGDLLPLIKDRGSTVVISHFGLKEAEEVLERDGVRYFRLSDFITNWFWENKKKDAIGFLDFPITMRCSLNCRDCMQYVPYRTGQDILLKDLCRQLEALFGKVAFVGEMSIIGGEPFLHGHIGELLGFIDERYQSRIGSLVITTNGTVVPDFSVLEQIRKADVFVSVSDYSDAIDGMDEKISKLEVLARQAVVKIGRKKWSWVEPGKFDCTAPYVDCGQTHMQLLDGKLWHCTLLAAGNAAGFCEATSGLDFWDLREAYGFHEFIKRSKMEHRTTQCIKCGYRLKQPVPSAVQVSHV